MTRLVPTRPRHRVAVAGSLVAVVLLFLSPTFGRADVSGQYRPVLPADGLTNGCYPLPGGVVPDFAYVLRRDGDTLDAYGVHRRVVLHFDRVSAAEATAVLEEQLAAAGVADQVTIDAHDFTDLPADAVVRGEMAIDLPSIGVQSDDPVCDDPNSTKRFTPDLPDRS